MTRASIIDFSHLRVGMIEKARMGFGEQIPLLSSREYAARFKLRAVG